jgi:hypothetical protein
MSLHEDAAEDLFERLATAEADIRRLRSVLRRIDRVLAFGGSIEVGTDLACAVSEVLQQTKGEA